MEPERVYTRALEVMEENFSHMVEMSLASAADGVVAAREVHAYYHQGKMFLLSKTTNTFMHHIAVCPNVGLCHGSHNMQGVARSLGHPCEPQNKELRKVLKKQFSLDYTEYVAESNPDMRIVEITLTKAETYTRYHRYEIDFVAKTAERDHTVPLFKYR